MAVVELSKFRLREGADEVEFLKTADATQTEFLAGQKGFLSRALMRGPDGTWIDMVTFASVEDAQSALRDFDSQTSGRAFEDMLDVSSVEMAHLEVVQDWRAG